MTYYVSSKIAVISNHVQSMYTDHTPHSGCSDVPDMSGSIVQRAASNEPDVAELQNVLLSLRS